MNETIETLKLQISSEKMKLLDLFTIKGYFDPELVKQSHQIDQLINQYERVIRAKFT
jgi:hypothetical protein